MKTILVPTDFSANANKALEYASKLALDINAKLVVMNSYQIPSGTSNVMINFADILEKDSKEELNKNLKLFQEKPEFAGLEYLPFSCYGYITEAIKMATQQYEIDLIVMGTTGASGIRNKFFGSNTVDAIRHVELPIFVVPLEAEYQPLRNLILASDQDQSIKNAVNFLLTIVDMNTTKLDIVSVVDSKGQIDFEESILNEGIRNIDYQVHQVVNSNVVDGILDYTSKNESDLVVLLRKSYSFIERIMHISVTKKMALHSKKPLLLFKPKI